MSWLSTIISKVSKPKSELRLKFSKDDNVWLVMKGHSILFMGDEVQCNVYLRNFNRRAASHQHND
jgi:hypothetical protein